MERRGCLRHRPAQGGAAESFADSRRRPTIRGVDRIEAQPSAHRRAVQTVRSIIASRHGDPNQVVSASRNPVSVPSPTQATYPSGLISTTAGLGLGPGPEAPNCRRT